MSTKNPQPDANTAYFLVLSGGAWRGAVQYWVIVHLMGIYAYTLIAGVSVGSINGVMAAMRKLDELLVFWTSIRSLRGYLRLRWFYLICYALGIAYLWQKVTGRVWMGGVYSMEPLGEKLKTDASLAEIDIPYVAGVVSFNTGKYYNLDCQTMLNDGQLHKAVLASSCMAPFMQPPLIDLGETNEEGEKVESVGFDGGGRNIFPVPHEAIAKARAAGKRVVVHAVGCMPRERILFKPTWKLSGLIAQALRGLEVLEAEIYEDDMVADLRHAVGPDGEVHVWLPPEHPGSSFDASKTTIDRRLDLSKQMVENGPTLVLKGIG